MENTESSWADLPCDLLALILKRLKTHLDNQTFRSVCTSWRSRTTPNLLFRTNLSLTTENGPCDFHLTEKTIYRIEPLSQSSLSSEKSWLICIEELENGKTHIINPLTGERIENSLPRPFPKVLDTSNYRLIVLQKLYQMKNVKIEDMSITNNSRLSLLKPKHEKIMVRKVIFLNSLNEIMIGVLQVHGTLSFYKLGINEWIMLKNIVNKSPFQDIANYKGKMCAISKDGKGIIVDSLFNVTEIARPVTIYTVRYHLIESCGDVLLAQLQRRISFIDNTLTDFAFITYKLHEEDLRWVEMINLDERVLIISNLCVDAYWCASIPSRRLLGLRNCIVWARKDLYTTKGDAYKLSNMDVFQRKTYKNGLFNFLAGDIKMLWPPPKWLV